VRHNSAESKADSTFTDLKITGLLGYTLRFSASGLSPMDSNTITITP